MNLSPWHNTLSQALDVGIAEIKARAEFKNEQDIRDPFVFDGIKYGCTKEGHAELATYKGKSTKKFAHITIYRAETGRYEVTAYCL